MSFTRLLMIIALVWQASLAWAYPMTKRISSPFHRVHIEAKAELILHQTSGPSYAIINADSCDLEHSQIKVQDDSLHIQLQKDYPHYPYKIEVWINNIHQLYLRDEVKVTGHQLRSSGLAISAFGHQLLRLDGSFNLTYLQLGQAANLEMSGIDSKNLVIDMQQQAHAKLEGKMNVCNMNLRDDAWLSLYWVKANRLNLVYGGKSFVQLAGRVNVLDLELYGHARFAGRYLRIDRAFVRTHDFSVAQICAERSQHTLALDASHIDYYNVASMKTDFMVDSGAVLDLREWMLPYMVTTDTGEVELNGSKMANDMAAALFRWVGTLSIGPAWANAKQNQIVYPNSNTSLTYLGNQSSSNVFQGELFLGLQKNSFWNTFVHFGVTGLVTSAANLTGNAYNNSDVNADLFSYQYQIQHAHIGLKAKLFKDLPSPVLPWVSASVGIGQNRSSSYKTQGVDLNSPLLFANNTVTGFTYTLGAGLQWVYLDNWQFGLGYEFASWGKSALGGLIGQTLGAGLSLANLYTQGVMFNLTYVC